MKLALGFGLHRGYGNIACRLIPETEENRETLAGKVF
jgi:hypothetical protein